VATVCRRLFNTPYAACVRLGRPAPRSWAEMGSPERVEASFASQPEPRRTDLRQVREQVLAD
jgi:hypothetical protein